MNGARGAGEREKKMATTIATHLVLESVRNNQTVNHVVDLAGGDDAGEVLADLLEMCEDSVDGCGADCDITEVWGTDENGDEWRVHVKVKGADARIESEAKAAAAEAASQGWTQAEMGDVPQENLDACAKLLGRKLTRDEVRDYVAAFTDALPEGEG